MAPPKKSKVKDLKKLLDSPQLSLWHQECQLAGAKVFIMVAPKNGGGLPLLNSQGFREAFNKKVEIPIVETGGDEIILHKF